MRGIILAVLVAAACNAPTRDPGADALVTVRGATFYRAEVAPNEGGSTITTASFVRSSVIAGTPAGLSGRVSDDCGGIVLQARGDVGHWVITPGIADPSFPGELLFSAGVTLAARAESPVMIDLWAVSRDGLYGAPVTLELTPELRPAPTGKVVVSLDWDVQADLDLRVVDPDGIEVWNKKINSYVPPAPPAVPGPDDYQQGGILDFDSNAACAIDGRRQENVVWSETAPPGTYIVRIDAFSLCGQPAARWRARAFIDGTLVDDVRGTALPSDTRFDHGPLAGLFVMAFTLGN